MHRLEDDGFPSNPPGIVTRSAWPPPGDLRPDLATRLTRTLPEHLVPHPSLSIPSTPHVFAVDRHLQGRRIGMENIHGVDVSWLHRSHKEHKHWSRPVDSGTPPDRDTAAPGEAAPSPPRSGDGAPTSSPAHSHVAHRPHLHHRPSSEKAAASPQTNGMTQKPSPASPPSASSSGRRNSWISGLTSKFSSSAPSPATTSEGPTSHNSVPQEKSMPLPQPRRTSLTNGTPPPSDTSSPYIPAAPKSSHPSFLQTAFRRFQSSSGQLPGVGRIIGGGGLCERRVLNVDPTRERCRLPGLNDAKLRRVAFCVDVEIAGSPTYSEDAAEDRGKKRRTEKDKKIKEKEEGEALKHPGLNKDDTAQKVVNASEENGGLSPLNRDQGPQDMSKKKEKKKRSEEERKEKREKKRRQAEADGSVPIENMRKNDGSSPPTTPSEASTPKAQDRPTTDPLRIYRRCCQLRETEVVGAMAEQLSAPTRVAAAAPGEVACLDLSDHPLSFSDVVTLADWLAVVPVKKIKLENCELGDEAVRMILGGLLASKAPHTALAAVPLPADDMTGARKEAADQKTTPGRHGVIEKLSLKNNPRIGRDGWGYICLFIYLSRSIKAIDLSMIPFPRASSSPQSSPSPMKSSVEKHSPLDLCSMLAGAISERLAGPQLEELIMSECDLGTDDIFKIIEAVSKCGLRRLGLASNHLTPEGLGYVAQFLGEGKCEGLDLGGNDLQNLLPILAEALNDQNPLYALSLADCNLVPSSLSKLFPALVSLPNFRFIDLSHNQRLFSTQPNALGLLRKYLPQLRTLKRIHLEDVALSSEHAIALAEILPESSSLAHLSILENPQLSALASAADETSQEEACALYASLMAAVRVSSTIICIDIDVPSPSSCEVVKALAKQVVAYCLRNMERGPVAEYDPATAATWGAQESEKEVAVPDVLLHIVGHIEGYAPDLSGDEQPAPDHDYVIGGTGVVKALGVCLGNTSNDSKRLSRENFTTGSGNSTPRASIRGDEFGKGKAKEMSKNLLGSARKIRARLQPALVREAKGGDDLSYRRLLFLDQTLERMIQRFEDEYPECRPVPHLVPSSPPSTDPFSSSVPTSNFSNDDTDTEAGKRFDPSTFQVPDDETGPHFLHAHPTRHGSDVSLAARALANEEGRMHRFGQQVRRDILRPQSLDHAHGTTGLEPEAEHLQMLRQRLEALGGMEIKERVMRDGPEAVLREIGANAEEFQRLAVEEPECFEAFRQAQEMAQRNAVIGFGG